MTLFSHQYLARNTKLGNFCNGTGVQGPTWIFMGSRHQIGTKIGQNDGPGRSTIYKNIKKLKGDCLKRTLGSKRKRILRGNDRR